MGCMACNAVFSCTTSRGVTLPTATFDIMRSKSPTLCSCSSIICLKFGALKKYSTTLRRSLMCLTSFSGNTTHLRSILPPIGVMVRSMTLSSDLPSSCMGCRSSSERMVNLSSLTYLSSSMRFSEVMWFMLVCCVSSRYCIIAPEATMPSLRCSTPNPFSDFVPKCFKSFCRAFCSVNTQSSSSNMVSLLPKNFSKSLRRVLS